MNNNTEISSIKNIVAGFIICGAVVSGSFMCFASSCSVRYEQYNYAPKNFENFLASKIQENKGRISCEKHEMSADYAICTYTERKLKGFSCNYAAEVATVDVSIDVCGTFLTKKIVASCPNNVQGSCTEIDDSIIQMPSKSTIEELWKSL